MQSINFNDYIYLSIFKILNLILLQSLLLLWVTLIFILLFS